MALVSTFTMEVGKGLPPQVFWNRHQLRTIGPDQSRLDAPAFEDVLQHRGVDRHLPQIGAIGVLNAFGGGAVGLEIRHQDTVLQHHQSVDAAGNRQAWRQAARWNWNW